jgi:hypothetical protein
MSDHQGTISALASACAHDCIARWNQTDDSPPAFRERYTVDDQRQKERELERLLERIPQGPGAVGSLTTEKNLEFWSPVRLLISRSLLQTDSPAMKAFFDSCREAGEVFARQARAFDPSLSGHDIRQALRNLWVFNSLQFHLGRSVCLTPSSFAYSLLYPYTDNWLDVPGRSPEEKKAFNRWIASRLSGERPDSDDPTCSMIDRLVTMIDREYPRSTYPDVADSLQAIHTAQQQSLRLQQSLDGFDEDLLLGLTVEKGGSSVLADGMLVDGRLGDLHQKAFFGFGVALQLIDDLQDLREDGKAIASTPFLRAARAGSLDAITNRLFHFVWDTAAEMGVHAAPGRGELIPLIIRSCDFLIMEAVVRYRRLYSREYLCELEMHLPVRSSYLASLRERLGNRYA